MKIVNDLANLKLSAHDIEELLKTYDLVFTVDNQKIKDASIENMRLPPLRDSFYGLCNITGTIPTQEQFFEEYRKNEDIIKFLKIYEGTHLHWYKFNALKLRVFRSYPSFVRETHIYAKLRDSGLYDEVLVNARLDKENDIDVLLKKNNMYFGLALFVSSNTSLDWRGKKSKRHNRLTEVTYIEIPITIKKKNNCGKFDLYTDKMLDMVELEIDRFVYDKSEEESLTQPVDN